MNSYKKINHPVKKSKAKLHHVHYFFHRILISKIWLILMSLKDWLYFNLKFFNNKDIYIKMRAFLALVYFCGLALGNSIN